MIPPKKTLKIKVIINTGTKIRKLLKIDKTQILHIHKIMQLIANKKINT